MLEITFQLCLLVFFVRVKDVLIFNRMGCDELGF